MFIRKCEQKISVGKWSVQKIQSIDNTLPKSDVHLQVI